MLEKFTLKDALVVIFFVGILAAIHTHKTGGHANILAGDDHVESGSGGFDQRVDGL